MWELDFIDGWVLKNWCFQTGMPEKTLESPLDSKEIKPVNPKGNQPWIFIGMTDAEAKAPILWPPDAKSWLIGKDSDAGKDWRQKEKRAAEHEMVGWHHWLNGHEFEQTLGDWRTGRLGILQLMGSWRVGHDLSTEQRQAGDTSYCECKALSFIFWVLQHHLIHLQWVKVRLLRNGCCLFIQSRADSQSNCPCDPVAGPLR